MRAIAIINFFAVLISSVFFCVSVIGADYDPSGVLLIGRPEQGGANFEQAQYPITNGAAASVWYLDPRSEGDASIAKFFPCTMPQDKPQQFGVVILEKGMLNEVAATVARPASLQTASILVAEHKSLGFTEEDELLLREFLKEYEVHRQKWWDLQEQQKTLSAEIAKEALRLNLLEESIEHGNLYYRIVGDPKDTYSPFTVAHFLIEKNMIVPRAEEYQNLTRAIEAADEMRNEVWKRVDPLSKRKDEQEFPASEETPSPLTTAISFPEAVAPNVVFDHIQTFVDAAWELVRPDGVMVIFAGDAKIAGTALGDGISKDFLSSKSQIIEERSFDSQTQEGQRYFSNPVLPAQFNIVGWSGGRDAGSYFVIRKR